MALTQPSTKKRKHRDLQRKIGLPLCYLFLIGFAIYTLVPVLWLGSLSVKPVGEYFQMEKSFIPQNPTLEHYNALFFESPFPKWMLNSLVVSGSAAAFTILIASMAGYAFAFYKFRGKETLFLIALSSIMVPSYILVIPWFLTFSHFGLINNYLALIIPWGAWVFALFFMRVYIRGAIHPEILEAARVDGASERSIFFKIVMPIIIPGIATLAIVVFTMAFNDFFWPLVAMRNPDMYTLPVGMAQWQLSAGGPQEIQWGLAVAGPLVSVLPMLMLFILFREKFTKGLTLGAPKG